MKQNCRCRRNFVAIFTLALGLSNAAIAQNGGAIPNDKANYLSDTISFPMPRVLQKVMGDGNVSAQKFVARPGTRFLIISNYDHDSNGLLAKVLDPYCIDREDAVKDRPAVWCSKPIDAAQAKDVSIDALFRIGKELVNDQIDTRRGYAYGALVVPYKFQLAAPRQATAGATLGGWVGYRHRWLPLETIGGVFVGATNVPTANDSTGKVSESQFGLSYGLMYSVQLKSQFQIGLVVGADRVSTSAGYPYQGKGWVALSFGIEIN